MKRLGCGFPLFFSLKVSLFIIFFLPLLSLQRKVLEASYSSRKNENEPSIRES